MLLKWFRARAAAIAPALLLSLAALALPHMGDSAHDADEGFALAVTHDADGHRIGAPPSNEDAPHHCAICHWSRSFRPLTQIGILASSAGELAGAIGRDVHPVAKADVSAQPPLRAPPVSPDFV